MEQQDSCLHIKDICVHGNWNLHLISVDVPSFVNIELANVFINEDIEDILIWKPSIYGTYITKSVYSRILDNTILTQQSLSWS